MTLNSRGFELSNTSNWGRRPTVIHGGDLAFSCSKMERDRVRFWLGYLAFVFIVVVVLSTMLSMADMAGVFEFMLFIVELGLFFIIIELDAGVVARLNGHWQRH